MAASAMRRRDGPMKKKYPRRCRQILMLVVCGVTSSVGKERPSADQLLADWLHHPIDVGPRTADCSSSLSPQTSWPRRRINPDLNNSIVVLGASRLNPFSSGAAGRQKASSDAANSSDPPSRQRDVEPGDPSHRMRQHGIFPNIRDINTEKFGGEENDDEEEEFDDDNLLIPLLYRYYARNRSRPYRSGSTPFILLGPNVDHWKVAATQLTSKGFPVMACERVKDGDSSGKLPKPTAGAAAYTLMALLDALRWNRAVLVACDDESVLAVQAALQLAPDRVVGVVLCGRLGALEAYIQKHAPEGGRRSPFDVDRYLRQYLTCPFTIVWGGDVQASSGGEESSSTFSSPSSFDSIPFSETTSSERRVILGGGNAPHRRRGEMFAWVLSRFVEEKIAPPRPSLGPMSRTSRKQETSNDKDDFASYAFHLPLGIQGFFSTESWVVFSRAAATALFYAAALKVGFYQYENLQDSFGLLRARLRRILKLCRKAWYMIVASLKVENLRPSKLLGGVTRLLTTAPRMVGQAVWSCFKAGAAYVLGRRHAEQGEEEHIPESNQKREHAKRKRAEPDKEDLEEEEDSESEEHDDKDKEEKEEKKRSREEEEAYRPPLQFLDRVVA